MRTACVSFTEVDLYWRTVLVLLRLICTGISGNCKIKYKVVETYWMVHGSLMKPFQTSNFQICLHCPFGIAPQSDRVLTLPKSIVRKITPNSILYRAHTP